VARMIRFRGLRFSAAGRADIGSPQHTPGGASLGGLRASAPPLRLEGTRRLRLDASRLRRRAQLSIALLAMAMTCSDAGAVRIDKERILNTEAVAAMPDLRAVTFMPQEGMGMLGRVEHEIANVAVLARAVFEGVGLASTVAGGVVGGVAGVMLAQGVREKRLRDLGLKGRSFLFMLEDFDEWRSLQIEWQRSIAEILRESGLTSGQVEIVDPTVDDYNPHSANCELHKPCLVVTTLWGISDDGRRIETQTVISLWTTRRTGSRQQAISRSVYANLLVYRSAPVPEIDRRKNSDDRAWLLELAEKERLALDLSPSINLANAREDPQSRPARMAVLRYEQDHQFRLHRAKTRNWQGDDLVLATARQWLDGDGALLRATLSEAMEETLEMLRIELSPRGQTAKQHGKFRWRDTQSVASVVRDGEREIVYLNDGTLVSRLKGARENIDRLWDTVYDEGAARKPASH
jgi:hypothetical protein